MDGSAAKCRRMEIEVVRRFAIVVAFALSGACAAQPVPRERVEQIVALDMSGPRPGVMLRIGDGPSLPAIIDTGAMATSINIERAAELGLRNEGPLDPTYAAHFSRGYRSTLRGATLGGIALPDTPVVVLPSITPDKVAVFSPAVFAGRLVRLDLAAGEMRILENTPTNRPPGPALAYSDEEFSLPVVSLEIGDQTIYAHIDTGSPSALSFPVRDAQRFTLVAPLREVGRATGHTGTDFPVYRARISGNVRVGPLVLHEPDALFHDAVPRANVGMALLRRLVITIDPRGRQLWIEARAETASGDVVMGTLTVDSTIGALLDDSRTRPVLDRRMPNLATNPSIELIRDWPLRRLATDPHARGLTLEQLESIGRDLAAAQAPAPP
jgi:hypothetical protein